MRAGPAGREEMVLLEGAREATAAYAEAGALVSSENRALSGAQRLRGGYLVCKYHRGACGAVEGIMREAVRGVL